jgi:hypothetical protein
MAVTDTPRGVPSSCGKHAQLVNGVLLCVLPRINDTEKLVALRKFANDKSFQVGSNTP